MDEYNGTRYYEYMYSKVDKKTPLMYSGDWVIKRAISVVSYSSHDGHNIMSHHVNNNNIHTNQFTPITKVAWSK